MIKLIKKYNEVIRYLIIGILTTLVSLSVYYVLVFTIFDPHKPLDLQIVNIISWVISVTFAYFTNRKFVFKTTHKITIYEASIGLGAMVTFIGLYLGIVFLISSAAILALKELTESTDNKERFDMLRKKTEPKNP